MSLGSQVAWLFLLAIPVACVSWTITHEEIFREAREYCERRQASTRRWYVRKLFYTPTCEYCFSHYVAAAFLALARDTLLLPGWRGYVLAWFAVVWVANIYMSVFGRLRLGIKDERVEIEMKEEILDEAKRDAEPPAAGVATGSSGMAARPPAPVRSRGAGRPEPMAASGRKDQPG